MKLTRRQFTRAATGSVALTILGCGSGEPRAQGADGEAADDGAPPLEGAPDAPTEPGTRTSNKSRMAEEPFLAGPLEQYRAPGVYHTFKTYDPLDEANKGVWLVSDGTHLIALAAMCTHNFCTTDWNPDEQHFKCPCHKSEFDMLGINQPGGKAKRPLDRCKMRLVDTAEGM